MGITAWHQEVLASLSGSGAIRAANYRTDGTCCLAVFGPQHFAICFIDAGTLATPQTLLDLQQRFAESGCLLIHLWYDVWKYRPHQVTCRLQALLGGDQRIHGRQAQAVEIDATVAQKFLEAHHLQGHAKAKYHYALVHNNAVVAVATFGPVRSMQSRGAGHLSAELIRFAHHSGMRVTGGLSKLLRHAIRQLHVNDIMTYADRDWSLGRGYERLGFCRVGEMPPMYFKSSAGRRVRLPDEAAFSAIFNTGSLKYILHV